MVQHSRYVAVAKSVLLEIGRPLDSNVSRFAACLEVCVCWYEDAAECHRGAPQREFASIAIEIADTAQRLLALLKDSRVQNLPSFFPNNSFVAELEAVMPLLERARSLNPTSIPKTGLEADFVDAMLYRDHFQQRSPFEWIAGVYLPELFYLFIDNTKSGKEWGKGREFISFAVAVLRALQIRPETGDYSRESISKAVRLNPTVPNKQGLTRRKNIPAVDADINDPWEWYRHQALAFACGYPVKTPLELVARLIRTGTS